MDGIIPVGYHSRLNKTIEGIASAKGLILGFWNLQILQSLLSFLYLTLLTNVFLGIYNIWRLRAMKDRLRRSK